MSNYIYCTQVLGTNHYIWNNLRNLLPKVQWSGANFDKMINTQSYIRFNHISSIHSVDCIVRCKHDSSGRKQISKGTNSHFWYAYRRWGRTFLYDTSIVDHAPIISQQRQCSTILVIPMIENFISRLRVHIANVRIMRSIYNTMYTRCKTATTCKFCRRGCCG